MSTSGFAPLAYPQLGREPLAPQAQAVAAGYAEGLRRARAERRAADEAARAAREAERRAGAARIEAAVAALQQAAARLDARLAPVAADAEAAVIDAALALAEAVLGREIRDGRTGARDALRRVFAAVPPGRIASVHLNPADLAVLRAARARAATPGGATAGMPGETADGTPGGREPVGRTILAGDAVSTGEMLPGGGKPAGEILETPAAAGEVHLVADPELAPGDAVAELEHGWLDARIKTGLARAREVLEARA